MFGSSRGGARELEIPDDVYRTISQIAAQAESTRGEALVVAVRVMKDIMDGRLVVREKEPDDKLVAAE